MPIRKKFFRSANIPAFCQKHGVVLLNGALFLLFLFVLAKWTWWLILARPSIPLSQSGVRTVAEDAVGAVKRANLFGKYEEKAAVAGVTTLNLKLLGVFASSDRNGMVAIVNTGDKNKAMRVGEEVLPGVILDEVLAEHVLLRRQGVSERLDLDRRAGATVLPKAVSKLDVSMEKDGSYRLAREKILETLSASKTNDIFGQTKRSSKGGVELALPPSSPFLQLGLESGDVIRRINDADIVQPEDLLKLAGEVSRAKVIHIDGLRNEKPLTLNYVLY